MRISSPGTGSFPGNGRYQLFLSLYVALHNLAAVYRGRDPDEMIGIKCTTEARVRTQGSAAAAPTVKVALHKVLCSPLGQIVPTI